MIRFPIGPAQEARLRAIRAHAEANPISTELLRSLALTGLPAAGPPGFNCEISVGFHVAFTVEQHPEPAGWCRHVSVAIKDPVGRTRLPNLHALKRIMEYLGMADVDPFDRDRCKVYFEGPEEGPPIALNLVARTEWPPHEPA